jgi:hypothetical protein
MSRIEYERIDLRIDVRVQPTGGATIFAGTGKGSFRADIADAMVDEWLQAQSWREPILSAVNFVADFDPWTGIPSFWEALLDTVRARGSFKTHNRVSVPRIVLAISDANLAGLDWEQAFRNMLPSAEQLLIVRTTAVWPRSAAQPLTFPLRILQVSSFGDHRIVDHVNSMLQHFSPTERSDAILVESCHVDALGRAWQYREWPTVEILHFDEFLQIGTDPSRRFSTSSTHIPGTLGWLCRIADVNQTRLIVLHAPDSDEASVLRELAAAVTSRGGPAVIVAAAAPVADAFSATLYERLIHDQAIDTAFKDACATDLGSHALFAGCGREDLTRVSNIGVGLLKLREALAFAQANPDLSSKAIVLSRGGGRTGLAMGTVHAARVRSVRDQLDELQSDWSTTYHFEDHESEALIPMARRMREIRFAAGVEPDARVRVPSAAPSAERFLNSSLWNERAGALQRIEQCGARLQVGLVYHLQVQIGEKDIHVQTVGEAPLVEEDFKWTPDMTGKWVEIGVIGIDFDVLGDAVQDFWLPREGDSEPIRFAISPRVSGAAWLRFCLYDGNQVLRSYRLAAVVLESEGGTIETNTAARKLAEALGVALGEVEGFGYMARLEYSISPSVANPPDRPQPALSLVANDVNGVTVITMKGTDDFAVRVSGSLKKQVRDARRVLQLIEAPEQKDLEPKDWPYGFALDNTGTQADLKIALAYMAEVGWRLFDSVIPGSEDQKQRLKERLANESGLIQVAHVLLEKVIPWALVYDREYDPALTTDREGNPVDRDVCLAALVHGAEALPCGEHAQCLLHEANLQRRRQASEAGLIAETVVCPLHFWGFRHVIEVPPQQVKKGDTGMSLKDKVLAGPQAELLRAMNQSLTSTSMHQGELDTLAQEAKAPTRWKTTLFDRTAIKNAMDDAQFDVLYFYCHARGGEADPNVEPPQLFFGEPPNSLAPEHMGSKAWPHCPLVILNGCGTVGYSSDAMSPFIEKLVQDRGAAGVLGTEIPVWEPLATEFARLFLAEFLNGQPAGQAVLSARRALLAKNNPLGLAYTLYAAAGLRLERS